MKRFALAAAVLTCATASHAADMPAAAPYMKTSAPIVAALTWQGFYIGAMGGYATQANSGSGALPKISGPIAGGTIGFQGQWNNIVAGIEADGGWADIKASATLLGATFTSRAIDTGTVRGRLGVAFDQVLLYGTGGFAWAQNRFSVSVPIPPLTLAISDTQFHKGWVAGGGVEWMFAPHWSIKAEYLYRNLSSENYFAALIPGGVASGRPALHSGQIGVNFHF